MNAACLGWFLEKEPSLQKESYSTDKTPYVEFLAHIKTHGYRGKLSAVETCIFCKILRKNREAL